jgi:hypothetical protein
MPPQFAEIETKCLQTSGTALAQSFAQPPDSRFTGAHVDLYNQGSTLDQSKNSLRFDRFKMIFFLEDLKLRSDLQHFTVPGQRASRDSAFPCSAPVTSSP